MSLRYDKAELLYCATIADYGQTLLRFELQPVSLAKPFEEKCVGFFLHTNMMFRVTERKDEQMNGHLPSESQHINAGALPGAPDE